MRKSQIQMNPDDKFLKEVGWELEFIFWNLYWKFLTGIFSRSRMHYDLQIQMYCSMLH